MKVEALIGIVIVLMLLVWALWFRFTTWLYKRRYKPENDKGKLAEDKRQQLRRDFRIAVRDKGIRESLPTSERTLLQTESALPARPDSGSVRKTSRRTRGIFTRLKRRS